MLQGRLKKVCKWQGQAEKLSRDRKKYFETTYNDFFSAL